MGILKGKNVYIYPNMIGEKRKNLLENIVKKFGANLTEAHMADFIFVDEKISPAHIMQLYESFKDNCVVAYIQWLTECIKSQYAISIDPYVIDTGRRRTRDTTSFKENNNKTYTDVKRNRNVLAGKENAIPPEMPVDESSNSMNETSSINQHICDKLKALSELYRSYGDTWRAYSYQKAISLLKTYPKRIESKEEVLKIKGIGTRIADKIGEIIETGSIEKLEHLNEDEETRIVKQFAAIYGVGPVTAEKFYKMGYRSLDQLKKDKAILTKNQQVGLKYYDELLLRIPRDESAKIGMKVREAAMKIRPDVIMEIGGSYRRKEPTSSDVDLIITLKDDKHLIEFFDTLIASLSDEGFLTDDLLIAKNEPHLKYLGICKLAEKGALHRRLDMLVVPYSDYACALLYFTGNTLFNRSIRNLAARKGMHLSGNCLKRNVVRNGKEKVTGGVVVETLTEEDIFRELGIPYRPPDQRDYF